jgi:hypothetical protein
MPHWERAQQQLLDRLHNLPATGPQALTLLDHIGLLTSPVQTSA